jgi:hypothetical protein
LLHILLIALLPPLSEGLTHVEGTVTAVVEIIHALTRCEMHEGSVSTAARLYLQLLLCPDPAVSFSAKHAIIRALKPRRRRPLLAPAFPPQGCRPFSFHYWTLGHTIFLQLIRLGIHLLELHLLQKKLSYRKNCAKVS